MRRRYKRRRGGINRRKIAGIGEKPGTRRTKEFLTATRPSAIATRTLYSYDITKVPRTTTNDNNERTRNYANIRGWRIYWRFHNDTVNTDIYFRWAIVACRDEADQDEDTTGFSGNDAAAATDGFAKEFFRDRAVNSGGPNRS